MSQVKRRLSDKQLRFIAEYVKDGNASRSALAAGYSEAGASAAMLRHPVISQEIAKLRKDVLVEAKYGLEVSVKEIDRRLKMAEDAKQFSAVAKLQELKMKAFGLLTEKIDVRQSGFSLNIVGVVHRKQGEDDDDIFG